MSEVELGSLWRRKPPGREVVEVRRIWTDLQGEPVVRAHPTHGGRPIVISVVHLYENYLAQHGAPRTEAAIERKAP